VIAVGDLADTAAIEKQIRSAGDLKNPGRGRRARRVAKPDSTRVATKPITR
jgi:hypothetical protein